MNLSSYSHTVSVERDRLAQLEKEQESHQLGLLHVASVCAVCRGYQTEIERSERYIATVKAWLEKQGAKTES